MARGKDPRYEDHITIYGMSDDAEASSKDTLVELSKAGCYTCERCNKEFTKQFNLTRHLQRKKPCPLMNPYRLCVSDYVILLKNVQIGESASREYILLLWKMCLSVLMLDNVIGYDRIYHFITQLEGGQLKLILLQTHSGAIRKVLLQIYTHLNALRSKTIACVNGRSIASIIALCEEHL